MTTAIVIFRLSELKGITFWSAFLDEVEMPSNGLEYRCLVEVGVTHKIRYNYTGEPGGSLKAEVIDHGTVLTSRDPAKIPLGETHSWDRLEFKVMGGS